METAKLLRGWMEGNDEENENASTQEQLSGVHA